MKQALCYSPLPIEAYSPVFEGVSTGPAASLFLSKDQAAWSLAFLSHPYETSPEHPDPQFTTRIRRTLQLVLSTGEIDLAGIVHSGNCVRHWLQMPAPWVVDKMRRERRLPLFLAYGQTWLDTIERRAWLCQPAEPDDKVVDMTLASSALSKFLKPTGD